MEVVGGIIEVFVSGVRRRAKGDFRYNLGQPKLTAVIGESGVDGFMSTPQVAFIEGEFTDETALDIAELVTIRNQTILLRKPNGKSVVLSDASFTGEGTASTREGNIGVRFEAAVGEEVAA